VLINLLVAAITHLNRKEVGRMLLQWEKAIEGRDFI
jgi:hypothetical protein